MKIENTHLALFANVANAFRLSITHLNDSRIGEVPFFQQLVLLRGTEQEELTSRISSLLAIESARNETMILQTIVCERPTDRDWHVERFTASAMMLVVPTFNTDQLAEVRDSALVAIVDSAETLGFDWVVCAFQLLCWVASQPKPYRSVGLDLLACSLACTRLAHAMANFGMTTIALEQSAYTNRYASSTRPPRLSYSPEVEEEWKETLTRCATASNETALVFQSASSRL